MDKARMEDFLRRQYEHKGYVVASITDPHAIRETLRINFLGRGPFGRHHIEIQTATVAKRMGEKHG